MRRHSLHSLSHVRPRDTAVALLGLMLAGAAFAAGTEPAAGAAAHSERDKAAAAAHASHGKPTSGVIVTPTLPAKMAVGETVTLRLQISGVTAAEGASVEVRDPATRATLLTARVANGETTTIEVPYTARSEGMQFIDVVTAQGGRTSLQALPLRVGTGELKLKPHGQRSVTSSGDAVISLPAASPGASR